MARIKPQALLIQSKKKKVPSRISATTIVICTSIVALIILLFTTYRHWSRRSRDQTGTAQSVFEDTNAFIDSKKYDIPGYAILNTSKGPVVVKLFKDGSPHIVDKFIDLCQKGHFKGMPFDHVIKNYVIHGGNSEGLGAAEDWTSKGKLHGQLATSPKHEAFMLGTSKTGDKKVFELYITTAPIPDLTDKLLVFGRVIKGEDVVQEIEEVDTDEHYQPKSPIGIINVTLKREV
ncbi:peptidyl-prolyl cis-trans isomerase cyclophilin-type family protein [Tripterygium wilfordii]|uniref:Peptidyl-prolyl cis-trans isomerase n=1 Tax=Tripterygium wilfordii TaxID=458696 RepID=A0A7J7E122_TRIWF|nr:peptidyl-prolyl cis-trans isomerase CYP21-4 [Tripterygium wilfordii]XP_038702039.1 peptidyl-prolyl cis-trans isomerase CYP21-4 [Tripterygium wilfordii]KAF5752134.1 peptidyl-prolyl cis-trans isomerase cyclophilin-type family protein [Tripterygium wilfordii]